MTSLLSKLYDILTLARLHPSKPQDVNFIFAGKRTLYHRCSYWSSSHSFYAPHNRSSLTPVDGDHGYRLYYRSRARVVTLGWLVPIMIFYLGLFLCQQIVTHTSPNWLTVGTLILIIAIFLSAATNFVNFTQRVLNQ